MALELHGLEDGMAGPRLESYLDKLHRAAARSKIVARCAVKVRNQMDAVICAYLGENGNFWQSGEMELVKLLAPQCRLFVDVGANVGDWSTYFLAQSSAKGVAYEPSAQSFLTLSNNVDRSRMMLRNIALSDCVGTMPFMEEDECGKTSSFAQTHSRKTGTLRQVSVSTLDEEYGAQGDPVVIDFLKIDAEGYDLKVLQGACGLLASRRIRFLQFEYNAAWLGAGSSLLEAKQYLKTYNYGLYLVRSTGLHPFCYDFWGDYFRYSNFFACHADEVVHVAGLIREPI